MTRVFADSSFFLALLNPKDSLHLSAVRHSHQGKVQKVTTRWVLAEVCDAFALPSVRSGCYRFVQAAFKSSVYLVVPSTELYFSKGLELYGARPDKSWSLTDCISFEVMREYGLKEALTADRHFEQAGFTALMVAA